METALAAIGLSASSPDGDPWLLTPGPLTTSATVKAAMLHDYGSRDPAFIAINRRIRERLIALVGGTGTHDCIPLQGSGTFVVEAMLATFVPRGGKLLILVNGAYGHRMARMCAVMGRDHQVLERPEDTPIDPAALDRLLAADAAISHVAAVHCETTSGVLNPLAEIAAVVAGHGRRLLIDAMSAFGALPVDANDVVFDAMAASSNKCLEGVPGMGFCLARREALETTLGNAHSLSLDLYDQWRAMEDTGQWRFTPPVHCLLALDVALEEHAAEGGVLGRGARYRNNCQVLIDGMRAMGFEPLLPAEVQAPIIVTFHMPADAAFDFKRFYDLLNAKGYLIYPGKLTIADSFRIGCIGRLDASCMRGALTAVREALDVLGVRSGAPTRPRLSE